MALRARVTRKACRVKAGLRGQVRGHGRSVNSKAAVGLVQLLAGGDNPPAQLRPLLQ